MNKQQRDIPPTAGQQFKRKKSILPYLVGVPALTLSFAGCESPSSPPPAVPVKEAIGPTNIQMVRDPNNGLSNHAICDPCVTPTPKKWIAGGYGDADSATTPPEAAPPPIAVTPIETPLAPVATPPVASAPVATPPVASAPVASAPENAELVAALAALKQAEQEVKELRAQLDKAADQRPPQAETDKKLDRLEATVADATSMILRVEFGYLSTEFTPSPEVAKRLIPAAQAASQVIVRGNTCAVVINEANKQLALARALAARSYLIDHGVDPGKIRTLYRSAGNFIADNTTNEGKAKNRRVDIELRGGKSTPAGIR